MVVLGRQGCFYLLGDGGLNRMQLPPAHQSTSVWLLLPNAGKKQEIGMEGDFFLLPMHVY